MGLHTGCLSMLAQPDGAKHPLMMHLNKMSAKVGLWRECSPSKSVLPFTGRVSLQVP